MYSNDILVNKQFSWCIVEYKWKIRGICHVDYWKRKGFVLSNCLQNNKRKISF